MKQLFTLSILFILFLVHKGMAQTKLIGVLPSQENYITSYLGNDNWYPPGIIMSNSPGATQYDHVDTLQENSAAYPLSHCVEVNGKLYGVTDFSRYQGGANFSGACLFEYDIITETYKQLYIFDHSFLSYYSNNNGGLLKATNGKLYGMAITNTSVYGLIYEFDIATKSVTIKHSFTNNNNDGYYPSGTLIQANDSKLYGMTAFGGTNGGVLFSYDYVSNTYTKLIDLGGFPFVNSLMQASNDKLYGMAGTKLFQYDIGLNSLTVLYYLDQTTGIDPQGDLVEGSPNVLYGMTYNAGANNVGTLFSYNFNTSNISIIHNFDTTAYNPTGSLFKASNGKLYGLCSRSNTASHNFSNSYIGGVLFEYDITTNAYIQKIEFGDGINTSTKRDSVGQNPIGTLMQASDGNLYGLARISGARTLGTLFQYKINTNSIEAKVHFSRPDNGAAPTGGLVQTSNGKLYGTTRYGGKNDCSKYDSASGFITFYQLKENAGGVIFEYDNSTHTYTKKIDLNDTLGSLPVGSMLDVGNGKLYGMAKRGYYYQGGNNGYNPARGVVIYEYDYVNNVYTPKINLDIFETPGESLIKAANGKLYGLTTASLLYNYTNTGAQLFEYDYVSNTYTVKHNFPTSNFLVGNYSPDLKGLVEGAPGKLYGITSFTGNGYGEIYEYDYINNVFTIKYTLSTSSGSQGVGALVKAYNGKLYGMTALGGANNGGVIFEYDIASNTYTKKYDFTDFSYPVSILKQATNGKLYGITRYGGINNYGVEFEYDYNTNTCTKKIDLDNQTSNVPNSPRLIEINNCPILSTAPVSIMTMSPSNTICFGTSITLSANGGVLASGATYAWYDANSNMTTSLSSTSSLTDTPAIGIHNYVVRIEEACGITQSVQAQITVTSSVWYLDADGDGYYVGSAVNQCASPGIGYVNNIIGANDCNDNDNTMHQTFPFYVDADGDGYGTGSLQNVCATNASTAPLSYALVAGDCDDNNALVNYVTTENASNGIDDNCNGIIDENYAMQFSNNENLYTYLNNNNNINDSLTFSCWVKRNYSGNNDGLFYFSNGAGVFINSNNQLGYYNAGNSAQPVFGNVPSNVWTHIAVVLVKNVSATFYINGVNVGVTNIASESNINSVYGSVYLRLGYCYSFLYGSYYGANAKLNGILDEVAVWNTARTQSQIQSDMCMITAPQTGLKLYYNFNQTGIMPGGNNAGKTNVYDLSGNNNTGSANYFYMNGNYSNWVTSFYYYQDNDHDGYGGNTIAIACSPNSVMEDHSDCDDNNANIHHTFSFYTDADHDGYGTGNLLNVCALNASSPPIGYSTNNTDCDDGNSLVWQSVTLYPDVDGDGYAGDYYASIMACIGNTIPSGYLLNYVYDCNDNDATVWQQVAVYADNDNDGYYSISFIACMGNTPPIGYNTTSNLGYDCDDNNPNITAGTFVYFDYDGDGYDGGTSNLCVPLGTAIPSGYSLTTLGSDCNDNDATIHTYYSFYIDNDYDGHGSNNLNQYVCAIDALTPPPGYSVDNTDCDDYDYYNYQQIIYLDNDGDGYAVDSLVGCYGSFTLPIGYSLTTLGFDCNDNNINAWRNDSLYVDNDGDGYDNGHIYNGCFGMLPIGYSLTTLGADCNDNNATKWVYAYFYYDGDGDGYTTNGSYYDCIGTLPTGYVLTSLGYDCNDNDPLKTTGTVYYLDADGDGYSNGYLYICSGDSVPANYSIATLGLDCDDNDPLQHEGTYLYVDNDGDGYDNGMQYVCNGAGVPNGYVVNSLGYDCNDTDSSVWQSSYFYIDADGDGYFGGAAYVCYGNTIPVGYYQTSLGTDCNDNNNTVWQESYLYDDVDGDGYNGSGGGGYFCYGNSLPSGYSLTSLGYDCNDTNANVHVNALEICDNGIDDNCNGLIDEGCSITLDLKLFIQGYYIGAGLMARVLLNQGEPSNLFVTDSIDVELHDENNYAFVAATKTILHTDGTAACSFPSLSGAYYIVVIHRNAIQTWSTIPIIISSNTTYDFTTAASKAYGNNQVEVEPGVWAFYSGDINADENIDLLDLSTLEVSISNFEFGYFTTDLNGDGNVDLLDNPVLETNISNFIFSNHP